MAIDGWAATGHVRATAITAASASLFMAFSTPTEGFVYCEYYAFIANITRRGNRAQRPP
jgi:hypothetical protein